MENYISKNKKLYKKYLCTWGNWKDMKSSSKRQNFLILKLINIFISSFGHRSAYVKRPLVLRHNVCRWNEGQVRGNLNNIEHRGGKCSAILPQEDLRAVWGDCGEGVKFRRIGTKSVKNVEEDDGSSVEADRERLSSWVSQLEIGKATRKV